jgi:hypothetical protein
MIYVIHNGRLLPVPAGAEDKPKFTRPDIQEDEAGRRFLEIDGEQVEITSQEQVREHQRSLVQTGTTERDGVRLTVTENEDGTYRVERESPNGVRGIVSSANVSTVLDMQGIEDTSLPGTPGVRTVSQVARDRQKGSTRAERVEAVRQQRADVQGRLSAYRRGDGVDLAAVLRSGDFTDDELKLVFGSSALRDARERLEEFDRVGAIQAEQRQAADAGRAELEQRIEAAGGVLAALYSDNPDERITREQALGLGYTDEQLDQAIADEREYIQARGEFEDDVRDQAAQTRAQQAIQQYRSADGYNLTQAVADGVSVGVLADAGFSQEDIATAQQAAQSRRDAPAIDSAAQDALLRRLGPYAGEEEGTYNGALAVAAGAITEDEARTLFGDQAGDVVRQAGALRESARLGYYADGSLIPATMRAALSDRAVELAQQFGRSPANDERIATEIQSINVFLSRGGLLQDAVTTRIASDVAGLERLREERQRELETAMRSFGADDSTVEVIRGQIRLIDQDLAERRRTLAQQVERAETAPFVGQAALDRLGSFVEAAPSEAGRIALREAALFAAGTAVTTVAVRGLAVASRAAGRGAVSAVESFKATRVAVRDSREVERFIATRGAIPAGGAPSTVTVEPEIARIIDDLNVAIAREARQANITRFEQVLRDVQRSRVRETAAPLSAAERLRLKKQLEGLWGRLDEFGIPLDEQGVPLADDLIALVRADMQVRSEAADRALAGLAAAQSGGRLSEVEAAGLRDELVQLRDSLKAGATVATPEVRSLPVDAPVRPADPSPVEPLVVPEEDEPAIHERERTPIIDPTIDPDTDPQDQPGPDAEPEAEPAPEVEVDIGPDPEIVPSSPAEVDPTVDADDEIPSSAPVVDPIMVPTAAPVTSPSPAQTPGVLPSLLPAFRPSDSPAPGPSIEIEPDPFNDPSDDSLFLDPFFDPTPLPTRDDAPGRPRSPRPQLPKPKTGKQRGPQKQSAAKLADPHHRFRYRRQGLFYVRFDTVTGRETYSRTPFTARKSTPTGKGSAKRSYRKGGPTAQKGKYRTEQMGIMTVTHNGAIVYKPRKKPKAKQPKKRKR